MPVKQHDPQPADGEKRECPQLSALIARHVMHALGQPGDLHRVQVRRLWEDRYRVNVLVGTDALTTRVAHSYFLVTDGEGNISTSSPKITKRYDLVAEGRRAGPPAG